MELTPEFRAALVEAFRPVRIEIEKHVAGFVKREMEKRSRASRNFGRLLARQRPKMQRAVNEMLDEMNKSILRGVRRMKGRTARQKVESLTDWKLLEENAQAVIKPALMDVLAVGGNRITERRIVKQERFDPLGAAAVKWLEEHGAELVKGIADETKKALVAIVSDGIKQGMGTEEIARRVRTMVGLQTRQATALGRFQAKLIAEGVPSTKVAAQVKRMANRMHRYRSQLIARTETASSLNEGIRQGYGQMGVKRLERVESGDSPDEECQVNNGRIYTLAEAQGVLPEHPGCEGVWVAA